MHNSFIDNVQKTLQDADPNLAVTENGALARRTTGSALVDMNFKLSSMRNMPDSDIWQEFLRAYNEDPALAVVWLFFARDIRGGCGERNVFRVIFTRLAEENPDLCVRLLKLIPEYGRWDDVIWVWDHMLSKTTQKAAKSLIYEQLQADLKAYEHDKPISLLAKWLPSENASSNVTRRLAANLRKAMNMTPRQYRKALSALRAHLNVVERKMSANEWAQIAYSTVPSKAGLMYRDAFDRHDGERYREYLSDVRSGKAVMHSGAIFPYEIVHAYMADDSWIDNVKPYDETLELKWQSLPDTVKDGNSTLVVVDGSGSMSTRVGNTGISCHDVARSLGIYFAERLTGAFKDSFITFSAEPKLIRFRGVQSLRSKLGILIEEDDCSNTDIEKTFDLILRTAVENHMKQEELPANILIVSDMEFDAATANFSWDNNHALRCSKPDQTLFETIAARWNATGYQLPRLVFWNVCSRTGAIPVTENDLGVALVSGFSPNIADMVFSGDLDPYNALVNQLRSQRYRPVWKEIEQA